MKIKHGKFTSKMVIVGFGSIAQAVLPLFFRHLEIRPDQVRIISAHEDEEGIARKFGVAYEVRHLTEENYRSVLEPCLNSGDFLVNLSVDVSSLALIDLCWQRNARYLDTSTEPWEGGYTDPSLPISERSNYALRDRVLEYGLKRKEGPTAVIAHGANPGLISTFAKKALLDLARDNGVSASPSSKLEWAQLACSLGIKAIHIAERDTQNTHEYKIRDEFVNTWSVDGMISESLQPAELGWGSHERHWPEDAERHESGCGAAIYLKRPGAATRVRSWTPLEGAYHGFLITHNESISLADYFTIKDGAKVLYRPTVHYAYHPCDDAVLSLYELSGNNWQPQSAKRILRDEICDGMDELGILLMGNAKGVYWYGSRLTIQEARQLVPYNNATSLQVAAGVLAAFVWALRNPNAGIVEAEDIDHDFVLEICRPYLGELVGIYGDWTPLLNRNWPFGENMDTDDPWQFKNIRVM